MATKKKKVDKAFRDNVTLSDRMDVEAGMMKPVTGKAKAEFDKKWNEYVKAHPEADVKHSKK